MKNTVLVLAMLIGQLVNAQTLNVDMLKGIKPRSIGPAGMSGRVTSIDVNQKNDDHILIGTAAGGVWQSTNGGTNWSPLFDEMPIQSIGAVCFDPNTSDILWAGTGEGNPRNSQNSGKGIYKSLDGGHTWKLMGLENTKTIHRVIVHPQNSDIVYVASLGSAWGANEDRGVFKTTNGGNTWKKILYVNDSTGCADLIIDPNNPNKLFAAMWQYQRQPWTFNSGGKGSGLYVTHDGGESWKKRMEADGLPKGDLGRIGLAISKSNSQVVYALIEAKQQALYKSYDGGIKWKKQADKNVGNRPFYYADIFADPSNSEVIYSLFSWVNKSTDGGKTFKGITPYSKIHPDHHALWINPKNSNHLIGGNDGGLTISHDGGKSWQAITNLPLGQFYHVNVDNEIPYNIYGGMQDNGSWKGPAYVYESGGIKDHHWQELVFGDGFDVAPLPHDAKQGYAMYQGGNLYKYNLNTGRKSYVKPLHKEGIPLRFNWNAALAQDPFDSCGIYFGSQFVHYSSSCGNNWEDLSPDLTTNDTTKQRQAESGGLTIDATNAENFTTILCIEPSSIDSNTIWVGTDDGNLQLTTDKGNTWNNLSSKLPDFPNGAWIPQIHSSSHSADEVYVVVNDYRRNNWQPYLYRSMNKGNTWTRLIDKTKVEGHVWCIVQDPQEKDLLFCGTDQGLYVSVNAGNNWSKFTHDLPATAISDLKIHPREGDLIISTFGRSLFVIDDLEPFRALVREQINLEETQFKVFQPKTSVRAAWGRSMGMRFNADASFSGENRMPMPAIHIYVTPKLLSPKEGATKDTTNKKPTGPQKNIEFYVKDLNGDTLRYSSFKPDSLFNRFYWNECEDGVEPLMRKKRTIKEEDKKFKPSGLKLLPGKYKLVFVYKSFADSCMYTITQHPNSAQTQAELMQLFQMRKAQQAEYNEVVKNVDKLKEIKVSIAQINGMLKMLPDSIADSLRKEGKALNDSVNAILDAFFLPEGFVGYDHVSVKLSNKINRIYSYVSAENALDNEMLVLAIDDFRRSYKPVQERINNLFEKQWASYQSLIYGQQFDYFKSVMEIDNR